MQGADGADSGGGERVADGVESDQGCACVGGVCDGGEDDGGDGGVLPGERVGDDACGGFGLVGVDAGGGRDEVGAVAVVGQGDDDDGVVGGETEQGGDGGEGVCGGGEGHAVLGHGDAFRCVRDG